MCFLFYSSTQRIDEIVYIDIDGKLSNWLLLPQNEDENQQTILREHQPV